MTDSTHTTTMTNTTDTSDTTNSIEFNFQVLMEEGKSEKFEFTFMIDNGPW